VVRLDLRAPVLGWGAAASADASVGKTGAPSVLTVVGKGAGKVDVVTAGGLNVDGRGVFPSLIDDSTSGGCVRGWLGMR
jgi:hypothetical protein